MEGTFLTHHQERYKSVLILSTFLKSPPGQKTKSRNFPMAMAYVAVCFDGDEDLINHLDESF